MILEARGLSFDYPGGRPALNGLNLVAGGGRKLAILGANGAGKTTLLLHLNGTLKPKAGEIWLDGEAMGYSRSQLNRWRRQVGLVVQDPDDQLFAQSVAADVSFGPLNLGLGKDEAKSRVDWALESLRIADLAGLPPQALSHGQKKRAAIAGLVAMRPKILLLDEPAAGLDAHSVAHLLSVLDKLVEAGGSLIFSTHDADLALAWADEVALFHEGRVLKQGGAAEILCDADLLKSALLKLPWAAAMGLALKRSGKLDPAAPLPRTRKETLALIEGLA
jgi:cobalt/nickel transport system ATP-binding protein